MPSPSFLARTPPALRRAAAACLAALACGTGLAQPAPRPAPITLYVGEAHVLNEPGVRRIAVGNGKVLQATALDERQVLVLPEAPGQSTVLLWGRSGPERSYVFNVLAADTARIHAEVEALIAGARNVQARVVADKVIVEGVDVPEEVALRVAEIARRYPQVVNLLPRVGHERMIAMDVKFIEIRRELLENIGVKWGGAAQGPTFQVIGDAFRSPALRPGGAAEGSGLQIAPRIAPFAGSLSLVSSLSSMLNFLVQSGDALILAEPRLSCRSGGSARFVAGGELPIPISGALGTASVAFKEYGIKFDVSPVATESGLIAAKIATEISAINFEVAVKEVPGLTKRRAETDVNLREHETLVIAGLLSEEGARNMDRVAGASDLPVLGPLFRSRQFRDRQTELVVFVTPRFVGGAPMPPEAAAVEPLPMRAPTRLLPALRASDAQRPASDDGMPGGVVATDAPRPVDPPALPTEAPPLPSVARPGPSPLPSAARGPEPVGAAPRAPDRGDPPRDRSDPPQDRADSPQNRADPPPPAAGGEDRGTVVRYRATRERLRMLD
jgi:Flp pilus assembly secretin CpaC